MSTIIDNTTFLSLLKQKYSTQKVEKMIFADNPFFAMVKKLKDWTGSTYEHPVIHGSSQGRSATYSNAVSNVSEINAIRWSLSSVTNYAQASVAGETIRSSKDGESFFRAVELEVDLQLKNMAEDTEIAMFGDGSGQRGIIATGGISTNVVTLATVTDALNFERDQTIVSGQAGVASGSAHVVTAVDYDAGTVTFDSTVLAGAAWAAGDQLYVQGDANKKLSGLASWLPATAPGASTFFGVDRSVNPTRLGGIRFDGSALNIREAVIGASTRAAQLGGRPDTLLLSYGKFSDLLNLIGDRALQMNSFKVGEVGFESVKFYGPRGAIDVVPDRACPDNVAYLLQKDTWFLASRGEPISLDQTDGLRLIRDATKDQYNMKFSSYYQLGCSAPGFNCRIKLS